MGRFVEQESKDDPPSGLWQVRRRRRYDRIGVLDALTLPAGLVGDNGLVHRFRRLERLCDL